MTKAKFCSQCGDPIPENAPGGECPKCLIRTGLEPVSEEDDPGYTIEELDEAFPHLEILEQIGRGGMGVIYRARQRTLDREVALKVLPRKVSRDPAFAERFNREAKALAKLSHPNIVYIHEAGEAGDIYYLVMELVDGVNLRQAIKVAIHRLRGRYRKILRREISETLSDPNDIESEIQVLMNAVQVQ